MPVSIRDDYAPGTRNGNTCSCCSAGRRDVRDAAGARKELIVDLGVSIDFEGYLMICESCVREAAGLLGMADPTEADALRARLDQVNAEAAEMRVANAEAHQLIDLLREYDDRRDISAATTTLGVPEPAVASAMQSTVDPYAFGPLVNNLRAEMTEYPGIAEDDDAGIEAAKAIRSSSFEPDPDDDPEPEAAVEPLPAAHDDGTPAFQYRRGPGRPRTAR